jgi:A-macroglobulin TED domain/MG2 domain/Alpha-2-macroglobulin family
MRTTPLVGLWALVHAWAVPALAADRVVFHDTTVVVDRHLIRGTEASAYVSVQGTSDLDHSRPLPGAEVVLALEAKEGARTVARPLATATTDARGEVVVRFRVPDLAPGRYQLVVRTRSALGTGAVRQPVDVTSTLLLHLRTDRPIYKPGQRLRWRVSVLGAADAHPKAGVPVELVIADPRRTKIWRGRVSTDGTGMASGDLPLGDDLVLGSYSLSASADGASTEEWVKVQELVLPPFSVEIKPDSRGPLAPGARLQGEVVAAYPYGEPVRGEVRLAAAGGTDQRGQLDAGGRWRFSLAVPRSGTALTLRAWVSDGAGRSREASAKVPLVSDRLEMAVIADERRFVPGEEVALTVVTTDGQGDFVPARVLLSAAGRSLHQGGLSPGAVRFTVATAKEDSHTQVEVVAVTDDGRSAHQTLSLWRDDQGARVTVAEALVAPGAPVDVRASWPGARGPVVATLLCRGTPLASAVARLDAGGVLRARIVPPPGAFGLATVRLVDAGFHPATGELAGSAGHATVFLAPARLAVDVQGQTRHAPGATAHLSVLVRDTAGRVVPGAGLAASVVDERVLALGQPRPDLVRVLQSLDVERARAAGIAFVDLLERGGPVASLALRALIEGLPPETATPFVRVDAAERVKSERQRLERAEPAFYRVLLTTARALGRERGGAWEFADELDRLLERAGWKPAARATPWHEPTDWSYARKLLPEWTFASFARRIAGDRLSRLEARLLRLGSDARLLLRRRQTQGLGQLVREGLVPAYLALDPWGAPLEVRRERSAGRTTITLASAGPDGQLGTGDDLRRTDVFGPRDYGVGGLGMMGTGAGGGSAGGIIAGAANIREPQELAVKVRQRFDETVLWLSGARTGGDGRAAFDVPLADSITGWQVKLEATSPAGAVGTGQARLETFLPLHVDADVPASLALGDRYGVAVVIANHAGAPRTLEVRARAGGGLSLAGEPRSRVTLAAGTTQVARFPVTAARTGAGELEITLVDESGRPVDAQKRTLRIEPPGALVREIRSGALERGQARIALAVPATSVPGSEAARLRVFRGAADQALDGLEDLLQEPHGCFEQTSSSTHPNLLVLELLQSAPRAEAVRSRALEYVARGYQRLVSYEVQGGGFSWFGESPANQVLTAYGLLEFTDMARVYPVDPALVARTRKWLLGKQQPDGSWKRDQHWLHDWSEVQGRLSTTAYIAWALAEAGQGGPALARALGYLRSHRAELERDAFLLGLWAGAEAAGKGRPEAPLALLGRHQRRHDGKLRFGAGGKTLFDSRGVGADVQVTSLAATALHRAGRRAEARDALGWIWQARSQGGWDSTQGIVMALRAAAQQHPRAPLPEGHLTVLVDGKASGQLDLGAAGIPTLDLPGLASGNHVLTVAADGPGRESGLLYDLRLTYREGAAPGPVSSGLSVEMTARAEDARVGGVVPLAVRVSNPGREPVPMPTVVVPVPPGFRAGRSALKALVEQHLVSRFEDHGGEVHLYLERLDGGASRSLGLEWEVMAECKVLQRPAVAYAYYAPATRGSSGVLTLEATSASGARAALPGAERAVATAATSPP